MLCPPKKKSSPAPCKDTDELFNYIVLVSKLTALLKNLDTAIGMGDGARSVRSAKYEMPIFNKTNKLKYVIGCVHLVDMSEIPHTQSRGSALLPTEQLTCKEEKTTISLWTNILK